MRSGRRSRAPARFRDDQDGRVHARFDDLLRAAHGATAVREARWGRYHFVYEVWGELDAENVKPGD